MRKVLSREELEVELNNLPGWHYLEQALEKEFTFPHFRQALGFMVQIGLIAEKADHHPELLNVYHRVRVRWNTHTVHDVTQLDVKMARETEQLSATTQQASRFCISGNSLSLKAMPSPMTNNIQIIRVDIDEVAALQRIGRQTFIETFAGDNTEENLRNYLKQSFSEKQLRSELSNPGSEFYFAIHDQEILGYLKLNYAEAQTESKLPQALEIERIYVLKAFHGSDIGASLLAKALQRATERKAEWIWLGVWEKNLRAIRFYQKNGFQAFDRHLFIVGEDRQTDILMKRKP